MDIKAWDEINGEQSREKMQAFLDSRTDSYAILQLKDVDETFDTRFMGYTWLERKGLEPEPDHYAVVYTDTLPSGMGLEDLYMKFNLDHPEGFTGHSLSVSDIVALKQAGVVTCHYVDSIGFKQLGDFDYLRNAEMAMEDDYGMIDGIVNNGPKEPERGRPSVLEKLKNAPEPERPPKPVKSREERGLG